VGTEQRGECALFVGSELSWNSGTSSTAFSRRVLMCTSAGTSLTSE
jgi:hypothetical protein